MMRSDDSFRGRVVISSDGVAIGEITRMFVDPTDWQVRSVEVRLRKDAADRVGIQRGWFHGATIEIPTQQIQSTGDAVLLAIPIDALRPPASERPSPSPAPT